MACGIAMALCSGSPPIQIRETPYNDTASKHACQAPRKFIVYWDMFVDQTLGRAGPAGTFTEDYLLHMFIRSLAVMHAYMRIMGVLPEKKRLAVSIKCRTRRTLNKMDAMDTKCSLHATVHVMEPASRHRAVVTQIMHMVRRDRPSAYAAMTQKDHRLKGIQSAAKLQEMGDYAGFVAMDTAMTSNWHQPVQCIGSSKGDGIVFRHVALVVFNNAASDAKSLLPVNTASDYTVIRNGIDGDDGDQANFPTKYPLRMAMLIAQHSAAMPDAYSITYTPPHRWRGAAAAVFDAAAAASLSYPGGAPVRKRKRGSASVEEGGSSKKRQQLQQPCPEISSVDTTAIPQWVLNGFVNAVHRATQGSFTFTVRNFTQGPANMDNRGRPETAVARNFKGTSFHVSHSPCIVAVAMDGLVKVHRNNGSFMWVSSTARFVNGEKLVYMKCLDPDCQARVASARRGASSLTKDSASATAECHAHKFDCTGWTLLSKGNMKLLDA